MKELTSKKRIEYIDIAKGIAILLMIIGHSIEFGIKRQFIFSFHMPLFIICSGFFFKDKSIKSTIFSIIKNLLIPYFVWLFIGDMIGYLLSNNLTLNNFLITIKSFIKQAAISYSYPGKLALYQGINAIGVLWFVPMLAICKIIFSLLYKIAKEKKIMLLIMVLLIGFLGFVLAYKEIWLPYSIDVSMVGIIFYYVGYLLHKYEIINKLTWQEIVLLIIIWRLGIKYAWLEIAVRRYPMFSIITAIVGSIVVIYFSKLLSSKIKEKILVFSGINSFKILGLHNIDYMFFKYFNILQFLSKQPTLYKIEFSTLRICFCLLITYFLYFIKIYIQKIKQGKTK